MSSIFFSYAFCIRLYSILTAFLAVRPLVVLTPLLCSASYRPSLFVSCSFSFHAHAKRGYPSNISGPLPVLLTSLPL